MRILLVGGTGVLGRATVPLLVGAEHDVHVTSRRPATDRSLLAAGATPHPVDVLAPTQVHDLVGEVRPDVIVRLATHIPVGPAALLPRAWRQNDVLRRDLSRTLADAAIAHGADLVGESIVLGYPDRGSNWIDATTPTEPVGTVATTADAEAAVARVTEAGQRGVTLRFGLFHGPGSGQSELAVEMARTGWLALPGPADGHVSLVDVRDAARAVVHALTLPAGVYDVVEDEPATRAEHAAALAELVGRAVRPLPAALRHVPRMAPVCRSLRVSNAALRETGWRPRVARTAAAWGDVVTGARDVAA